MLKNIPSFVVLVSCLCLTACRADRPSGSMGKAYMKGFGCLTCHRVGSEGGNVGPDLTFIGFRHTPEWLDVWLKDPRAWKADTDMPNPLLNEEARKALVAYMATLKGEAYRQDPPWNKSPLKGDPVQRGKMIYYRAGCAGCHGQAGQGGFPNNNVVGGKVPSLKMAADGYSKEELKEKIRAGVAEPSPEDLSRPKPMISMPAWGQVLREDELDALVEYLYSLRPPLSDEESWGR